jgi:type 1 glutamine amidotransferase
VLHQRPLRSFHSDPSRVEAKGAVRTMPSPPLRTAFVMPGVDARREGNGRLNFTVTLDHPAAFQASSGGPTEERTVTYDYWGGRWPTAHRLLVVARGPDSTAYAVRFASPTTIFLR